MINAVPKPKKNKRKTVIKRLDREFSLLVRKTGMCKIRGLDAVNCGGNGTQCMHLITRGEHALRWDFMNALEGCPGHHFYYTNHPWEWIELIRKHFPKQYAYIEAHRNDVWDKDLERVQEYLNNHE